MLLAISGLHIIFLHQTGSNNPLGLNRDSNKVPFHSYFRAKDGLAVVIMFASLGVIRMFIPVSLGDPENFIPANSLVTPIHIKPEWYFL